MSAWASTGLSMPGLLRRWLAGPSLFPAKAAACTASKRRAGLLRGLRKGAELANPLFALVGLEEGGVAPRGEPQAATTWRHDDEALPWLDCLRTFAV
jgi:hypothetical protein